MSKQVNWENVYDKINFVKKAFAPMPPDAPQPMPPQGMPMDPAMMQGGGAPVDPATGMPMDPAMMQGGGAPMEVPVEEIMAGFDQITQAIAELQAAIEEIQAVVQEAVNRVEKLENDLTEPTPPPQQ
jgi:hypothetical protein